VPGGCTAVPGGCTAVPGGCTAVPGGCTAVPGGCTAVPGGCTAVPDGCTTVPDGCTAVPGGCTAVPFCCTLLPEVFVEVSSSVHPSPIYFFYISLRPLWFCWFVLAGVTLRDHRAASAAYLNFVLGFDFELHFGNHMAWLLGSLAVLGGSLSFNLTQHCHVIGFWLLWVVSKLQNFDPLTLAPRVALPPQRQDLN